MPWAQPPSPAPIPTAAPPAPSTARPQGPSVWNVPSAPTPTAPPATPPVATPPAPPKAANGSAAPPFPPFPPTPSPSPVPAPPPSEILEIATTDLKSADDATTKSKEAKDSKPPKPAGDGRSRRPLVMLGALVLVVAGGAVGGMYAGVVPDVIGIRPAATETPIADVTPTPAPTATAESTATAIAAASSTPEQTAAPTETPAATAAATATPAATATVAATPTPAPTATATAIAMATPKPTATPAPTKAPEDPEVKKKKAVGLVKIGNDALNAGDGPKAIRNFGAAIANDPNNAEAYLGLGTAYMLQGENAKAKSSFKKFLQLAPDHQYAAQTRQILGTL